MKKAFIFDVDGTLIDSVEAHARSWVETFAAFGKKVELEQARKLIGMGGDQFLGDYFTPEELEKNEEKIEKYRSDLFKKEFLNRLEPFPKVREFLETLRKEKIQIVLASSAKKDEVAAYKKIANIEDLIDDETSTDDAEESKPEPDIFQAAFKKLVNVEKNDVLIVGDTPYDAIAARKADFEIVGVLTGGWSIEELEKSGCKKTFKDIAEVYENFKNL